MSATTIQPADVSDSQSAATRQLIHDRIAAWLESETGLIVERIDYDASLWEYGVTSLGVASITEELERKTGKTLDPEVVFSLETINELAEYLDELPVRTLPASPIDSALLGAMNGTVGTADERPATRLPSTRMPAPDVRPGIPAAPAVQFNYPAPFTGLTEPTDRFAHYRRMNRRVNSLKQQGLYFFEPEISEHDGAYVTANGQRMLMLGSYEYLGLLGHPHLKETARAAIDHYGTGHHGVRLLAGTTSIHRKLEAKLAAFMQAEDAIVFSSGYVTNLATISSLVGRGDVVIGDQWNHASIADGCRMSGAEFLEFEHNHIDALAARLEQTYGARTLVVVDAVFSMDGDIIDLPAVVDLCRKYNALLMVDEAHSLGVLGLTGRGVQEHFGLAAEDIDIKMGTLSKTLAGCGGFVAANEEIVTYLRHHARGYIFSGALPAGQASVAIAALEVIEREPELVTNLRRNVTRYLNGLKSLGFDTAKSVTPIVPVMTRTDEITLEMTRLCRNAGLLVIPVCYPAVPADAPRLRTCVSAIHSDEDIDFAIATLADAGRQTGLIK